MALPVILCTGLAATPSCQRRFGQRPSEGGPLCIRHRPRITARGSGLRCRRPGSPGDARLLHGQDPSCLCHTALACAGAQAHRLVSRVWPAHNPRAGHGPTAPGATSASRHRPCALSTGRQALLRAQTGGPSPACWLRPRPLSRRAKKETAAHEVSSVPVGTGRVQSAPASHACLRVLNGGAVASLLVAAATLASPCELADLRPVPPEMRLFSMCPPALAFSVSPVGGTCMS